MLSLLDSPREIARIDTGGMLDALYHFADPFFDPPRAQADTRIRPIRFNGVVLIGMGGSASAGDVILDWLRDEIGVFSLVSRESRLPRIVDKNTLVVCFSYSGETWETLRAFKDAWSRKCSLVGVGSGGLLAEECGERRFPFFRVRPGLVPRAALGEMIVAGSAALERLGVIRGVRGRLMSAGSDLASVRETLRPTIPSSRNSAKKLALVLRNRFPVIYGLQRMSSIARRFKNQLAENSKVMAKYELLPEAGHNEVVSWRNAAKTYLPLILRDSVESPEEHAMSQAFKLTISKLAADRPLEVRMRARSDLGRLVSPILFLDYVSAYLAILRKMDPSLTPEIQTYRHNTAETVRVSS